MNIYIYIYIYSKTIRLFCTYLKHKLFNFQLDFRVINCLQVNGRFSGQYWLYIKYLKSKIIRYNTLYKYYILIIVVIYNINIVWDIVILMDIQSKLDNSTLKGRSFHVLLASMLSYLMYKLMT